MTMKEEEEEQEEKGRPRKSFAVSVKFMYFMEKKGKKKFSWFP